MKVRDVIKLIRKDGWYLEHTRGSHHQYRHTTKQGTLTISGQPGDEMPKGTLNSVMKHAGLKK